MKMYMEDYDEQPKLPKDALDMGKEQLGSEGYPERYLEILPILESLVSLKNRGIDLDRYGVKSYLIDMQTQYFHIESETVNKVIDFRYCCDNGLNLFMFKTYAWRIDSYVVRMLVILMKKKKDYTMLLDYSRMKTNEVISFIEALSLGVDKSVAMKYHRFINSGEMRQFVSSSKKRGVEVTYKVYQQFDDVHSANSWMNFMDKMGMSINQYKNHVRKLDHTKLLEWQHIVKHTGGDYVPYDSEPYGDYIKHLVGYSKRNFTENCILEACHIVGKPVPNLRKVQDSDTAIYLVRSILKGEDYEFYMNLGLSEEELLNTFEVLSKSRKSLQGNHIGLKIYKTRMY